MGRDSQDTEATVPKKVFKKVFEVYRAVHEQGFVPIFTDSPHDPRLLVEACAIAGCRVIEYTLRRRDIATMIPWIHRHFPELRILAGSTIENPRLLDLLRPRYRHLLSLEQLADLDVAGFVSMTSWSARGIGRWSSTHVVVPTASTLDEGITQLVAGAHFIKMIGPDMTLVRWSRSDAVYGFCPVMLTGGISLERLPAACQAGIMLAGTGFELILQGVDPDALNPRTAAERICRYLECLRTERNKRWPGLAAGNGAENNAWLASLPHCHHFGGYCSVKC